MNCLEGKSMTPCQGNIFSSDPLSNSLVSISDPWRAFWAYTWRFKDSQLASCDASGTIEIHGHQSDVSSYARRGPRTPPRTTNTNLVFVVSLVGGGRPPGIEMWIKAITQIFIQSKRTKRSVTVYWHLSVHNVCSFLKKPSSAPKEGNAQALGI